MLKKLNLKFMIVFLVFFVVCMFLLHLPVFGCKLEFRVYGIDGTETTSYPEEPASLYEILTGKYNNCSLNPGLILSYY